MLRHDKPHCLPSSSRALPPHAKGTTSAREGDEGPGAAGDELPSAGRSSTITGVDTGAAAVDAAPSAAVCAVALAPPVAWARCDFGGRADTDEMACRSPWKVEPNNYAEQPQQEQRRERNEEPHCEHNMPPSSNLAAISLCLTDLRRLTQSCESVGRTRDACGSVARR